MLFHSLEFLVFFPTVVVLFFATPHAWRWAVLLLASYGFYMSWQPEYALLLLVSTVVDFYAAKRIHAAETMVKRRLWLALSLSTNLGMLAYYKYTNFAFRAFDDVSELFGFDYDAPRFDIILPIGISFYTFQTISYSLDIFWKRRKPEPHLGRFALYVSFFPQLVAGPIERSTKLLPQFSKVQTFSYNRLLSGSSLIVLGFFKKLVIGDRAALLADDFYANPEAYSGGSALIGCVLFAIQIYCDFSAYSDIAIGCAKILGFDLMENFRTPYFAKSMPELWRRWHISLSTWLRDYLMKALTPNDRKKRTRLLSNLTVTIIFIAVGVWHGAEWTFVAFGFYHAFLVVGCTLVSPYMIRFRKAAGFESAPWLRRSWAFSAMGVTFMLWSLGSVFFRAQTIEESYLIFWKLFSWADGINIYDSLSNQVELVILVISYAFLISIEYFTRLGDSRTWLEVFRPIYRPVIVAFMIFAIHAFGEFGAEPFYYFQF